MKIDQITRHIRLEGELSDAQPARLLDIADQCPIHRTLVGPLVIKTALDTGHRPCPPEL